MKQYSFLTIFMLLMINGCGTSKSKEDTKKELDDNTLTLSPTPGNYENGVVVVFKKKDEGSGSGVVEIQQTDGAWKWVTGSCVGGVSGSYCVNVKETTTFKYRLATSAGESSESSATYTITPKQNDVVINSTTYTEHLTDCAVSSSGGITSLKGRIKISNDAVLGASKVAYVIFEVNDVSKLNTPMTITSSYTTGLTILGTGDSAPSSGNDFYPSRNSSSTTDQCVLTLTEFTAGQTAKGAIKCDLSLSEYSTATVIGKTFTLSEATWQCDAWVSSI